MNNDLVTIHPEIKKALEDNKPVVALESTIISHGMPWPRNVETAMSVEDAVRKEGAVPATIAIRNGSAGHHFHRNTPVIGPTVHDSAL